MVELQDIIGVGASRAEDLQEMGYTSVEDVANANPEDLTELSRVAEDRAVEIVVNAQNLSDSEKPFVEDADSADEGTESGTESETITFDEEDLDEVAAPDDTEDDESDEAVELVEEEREPSRVFELSTDFSALEYEVAVYALLDGYTRLRSRNVARSNACLRALEKLRDGASAELTEEELNAFHAAIRQQRLEYQGNNHVEMMRVATRVEDSVSALREAELF
jgi:hypothetical protein